jgi:protein-L-isoaspartate(D-aspartate) O-methyltransferase
MEIGMLDLSLESMIQRELVNRGITSQAVIEGFRRIPRPLFVPEYLQHQSMADENLPIGLGQTLSPPYVIARMMQELELTPKSRVLEIGTGSGFQTAMLSLMCEHVYTVELLPELSARARRMLVEDMKLGNISLFVGDGTQGWSDKAPFDGIIVGGAVEEVPSALIGQLRDGGRLVIPVNDEEQSLHIITRVGFDDKLREIPADVFCGRFRDLEGDSMEDY